MNKATQHLIWGFVWLGITIFIIYGIIYISNFAFVIIPFPVWLMLKEFYRFFKPYNKVKK